MAERVAVGVQIRQGHLRHPNPDLHGGGACRHRHSPGGEAGQRRFCGSSHPAGPARKTQVPASAAWNSRSPGGTRTTTTSDRRRIPKLGVVWSPVRDLALRASWGTSFRAASLPQIHDASVLSLTTVPRGDGGSVLALYQYGGNADLKPETAETFTIGFDYRPRGRLNVSAGYFDTRFTDRIAQPATENLAGVLTDPALAPFVTRVSPGSNAADLALVQSYISRPDFAFGTLYPATSYGAIIDGRWVNTGAVRVNGFDLSARYPLAVGSTGSLWTAPPPTSSATRAQTTPTASVREVVDLIGYPVRLRSASEPRVQRRLERGSPLESCRRLQGSPGCAYRRLDTADLQAGWSPSAGVLNDSGWR